MDVKGKSIKLTSVYKYTGLLFTPKVSWYLAKRKLASQASKTIFRIYQFQRPFGKFPYKEYFKIFDSMVMPILTYGAEIWGFEISDSIEQIRYKFCKDFLGLNSSSNNLMALGECGRYPLSIHYQTKFIKYWIRLLHMEMTRYPRNCYNMLKRLDDCGKTNWVSKVRQFLFLYGFGIV